MLKYSKDDIKLYFDLLGYDIGSEIDKYSKGIKLDSLGSLFIKYELDRKLPKHSKDLSDSLSVLFAILNDGFWFDSKKSRQFALNSALGVIRDLSSFQVCASDNLETDHDLTTYYERTSSLLATIIAGLCEVEDINHFRMFQKNSGYKLNYGGIDPDERTDNLVKLYLLAAYSKFEDVGRDYLMFDEDNKVSSERLKRLISYNLKDGVPFVENKCEKDVDTEIKMPTLEKLRK